MAVLVYFEDKKNIKKLMVSWMVVLCKILSFCSKSKEPSAPKHRNRQLARNNERASASFVFSNVDRLANETPAAADNENPSLYRRIRCSITWQKWIIRLQLITCMKSLLIALMKLRWDVNIAFKYNIHFRTRDLVRNHYHIITSMRSNLNGCQNVKYSSYTFLHLENALN